MCEVKFAISLGLTSAKDTWSKWLSGALAITAGAWIVSVGGLGAMQDEVAGDMSMVQGVWGFSQVVPPSKVYSYYWFVIALEFVTLSTALWILATNSLKTHRGVVVGLFTISTLLYIQFSNAFLGVQAANEGAEDAAYPTRDRLRATIAGAIMTAAMNAISVFMFGYECNDATAAQPEVNVAVSSDKS
mmetsp:Transcript_8714/g.18541  ORF Transcript_8714/g.18541 Transcript_8714/m.18541 type:complete len:188 (+) Transcript_8714:107-670(+)